jgi:chromosome partitioning protein
MAIIIPIANQKGGVGKTTTAVNVAVCLSYYFGKKVLLVDLDLSCNATACLGYKAGSIGEYPFGHVLTSVAKKEPIPIEKTILPTSIERLTLIPGDRQIVSHFPTDYPFLLQDTLSQISGNFDYILIDTPPSRSPIITHTYFAADWLIVPVEASPLALEGLADTIEMIYSFSRQRANIDPANFYRILLTKVDSRESKSVEFINNELEPFKKELLQTVIRINADLKHAQEIKQSIFHFNHQSTGALDYYKLSEELIAYDQDRTNQKSSD